MPLGMNGYNHAINVDPVAEKGTYKDRSVNNTQPTNSLDSEIRVHDTKPSILGCHCGSPNGMIYWSSGLTEIGVNFIVGWFSTELKRFHNVVRPCRPGKKTTRSLKCFSHGVSVKLGTEIIGVDDGMSEWVRWAQGKITAFEGWRSVIAN